MYDGKACPCQVCNSIVPLWEGQIYLQESKVQTSPMRNISSISLKHVISLSLSPIREESASYLDCCAEECKTRMMPLVLLLSVGLCRLATVEDIMGGKVYMLYVAVKCCGLSLNVRIKSG